MNIHISDLGRPRPRQLTKVKRNSCTGLFDLPIELLPTILEHLCPNLQPLDIIQLHRDCRWITYHGKDPETWRNPCLNEYHQELKDITSLRSTCTLLNEAALPLSYRNVVMIIHSGTRLSGIENLFERARSHIQSFIIDGRDFPYDDRVYPAIRSYLASCPELRVLGYCGVFELEPTEGPMVGIPNLTSFHVYPSRQINRGGNYLEHLNRGLATWGQSLQRLHIGNWRSDAVYDLHTTRLLRTGLRNLRDLAILDGTPRLGDIMRWLQNDQATGPPLHSLTLVNGYMSNIQELSSLLLINGIGQNLTELRFFETERSTTNNMHDILLKFTHECPNLVTLSFSANQFCVVLEDCIPLVKVRHLAVQPQKDSEIDYKAALKRYLRWLLIRPQISLDTFTLLSLQRGEAMPQPALMELPLIREVRDPWVNVSGVQILHRDCRSLQ